MHSYPIWRMWLVAVVLLAALVFALPNVFGDARAPHLPATTVGRHTVSQAGRGPPGRSLEARTGDRVLRFDNGASSKAATSASRS
jgi:hypothetical protein